MLATMNPAIHRKPLPGRAPPSQQSTYNMPPQQQSQYPPQQQQQYYQRPRGDTESTMATNTEGSMVDHRASSIYSFAPSTAPSQQMQYGQPQSRRTLSNATSSTSSSATNTGLQRAPTNSSAGPRRSTSSRSNTSSISPTSYVALMRKQKATVWCDRAQSEDPRILAAQRAAKMRAAMEVAGGSHRVSTSSSQQQGSVGIRSKIRHHGAPKAAAYTGTYISSGGVPMRLSASEVDDGNDSDEEDSPYMNYHRRNGSGRSSLGSRNNSYLNNRPGGLSNGSTPPSGIGHSPIEGINEEETPVQNTMQSSDYFAQTGGQGNSAGTPGSEEERQFGGVGGLPQRELTMEEQMKKNDDLRRRGSVDDRTMTMSAGRLFVANPDLSD